MLILLLPLLLTITLSSKPYENKIKRLSPDNTTNLIICITTLKYTSNEECQNIYRNMTGKEYDTENAESIIKELKQLQQDHINHKSWYSKMINLITFSNILLLLLTIVCVAFVFSFIHSFLLVFTEMLAKIFLSKTSLYIYALVISYLTICIKYEDIANTKYAPYYILEYYTVVFGSIILMIFLLDLLKDLKPRLNFVILSIIYCFIAVYHNQSLIATLSVICLYSSLGFFLLNIPYGYSVGFDTKDSLERSAAVSIIIVPFYMALKTGIIQTEYIHIIELFENGCLFFGTFIGLLSMLIIADKYYHYNYYYYTNPYDYYFKQVIMIILYTTCIYFGLIFNLQTMKSLGGTFMVLHFLDMEYHYLSQFRTGNLTGSLFVLAANIWLIRHYILYYREYFIF